MEELNKRKLQAEKTKSRLVETIIEFLKTKDLNEVTIREICKSANVSTGTFYLYFKSKEEAILYIYHRLDETFNNLNLSNDTEANIRLILDKYYRLMSPSSLDYDRKIYKCHLSHYDSYFFSEERPVFKVLRHEIENYIKVSNYDWATWMCLEFTRGRIYNKMIRFTPVTDIWYSDQVDLTIKYLSFIEKVIQ